MIKHIFTDMDGTILESKKTISKEMIEKLHFLRKDIIVVSGQDMANMEAQLKGLECVRMPQSGNESPLWINTLSKAERVEIYAHILKIKNIYRKYMTWKRNDFIRDLGCQLNFSFMGHGATYEDKINFDPDRKKRLKVIRKVPLNLDTLNCAVGGTSCLEYTKKDGSKGKNIERYINEMKWDKAECIFFGDALFPGGNDESVKGIISCIQVSGPDEMLKKLELIK